MPDKKISPESGKPNQFRVLPVQEQIAHFPQMGELLLILPDELLKDHMVVQKDLKVDLNDKKHNGRPVHWINNFGIRKNDSKEGEYHNDLRPYSYTIVMDEVQGASYVYYDGSTIQPLPTAPNEVKGKVQATLTLGDPPIGWEK